MLSIVELITFTAYTTDGARIELFTLSFNFSEYKHIYFCVLPIKTRHFIFSQAFQLPL